MDIDKIYALILCGGKGTRLRGVVKDRPKPMAEVCGQPFLNIIIKNLINDGIKNIVLCTGYMSEYITDYYEKFKPRVKLYFSRELKPLGTAGAIKNAKRHIKSNPFFVLNGDSFCKFDMNELLHFHSIKSSKATILLSKSDKSGVYGSVNIDKEQRILDFREKYSSIGTTGHINAGIYLFNKEILELIPEETNFSLEYNLFPKLSYLFGFTTDNQFIDIGTAENYGMANSFYEYL